MTVLLGFGASKLLNASFCKPFAGGFLDCRRWNKEAVRELQVAIILEHASVANLREANAVKFREAFFFECAGDFDSAVTTEVEEYNGVAIVDCADSLAVLGDNERRQILVDSLCFATESFDSFGCACKHAAFAKNVCLPAEFNHLPVSIVTVHGNLHTATTASDSYVEVCAAEVRKELFERANVIKSRCFWNIAAVEQNVDANNLDSFLLSLSNHCLKVGNVRMNVTVAEKADEVKNGILFANVARNFLPSVAAKDVAGFDSICNESSTLVVNLACTDSVMANFGVTHVFVCRHTDSAAVSLQENVRILGKKSVEGWLASCCNSVTLFVRVKTITIHHDGNNRALNAGKIRHLLKHIHSR